ncbi:MAG TPA: phosphoribosylformylglycinamidine synthase subunit PurS [Thermoanaerobaculia bacterium]|jgi:phosphoribosylformylglycinamidine synthase PurS subunit|nr:phosphoribosylformylglycinamidine synthase subunit PurS [Thermoanaerobaculia bacterium]
MKATVIVELKSSVLDPQGKAIQHSLGSLGFGGVEDVRVGKLFRLTLADDGQSHDEIERQLRSMCERLLANTVMENFSWTVE